MGFELTDYNRNKNGRGATKHYYKAEDVAILSNRAVGTIHNASCKGQIDLDDLTSVFKYCQKCKAKDFNGEA